MNLLKGYREIQTSNADLMKSLTKMSDEERRRRHMKAREIPTINCDSWTIVRPATDLDNRQAKNRIMNRLRKAFWL